MAHRSDHEAALARAEALQRELKRARKRAEAAEARAAAAEKRAAAAETQSGASATAPPSPPSATAAIPPQDDLLPIERLAQYSHGAGDDGDPSGAFIFLVLLFMLAATGGIIWLVMRAID